jgi:hypothetical protein
MRWEIRGRVRVDELGRSAFAPDVFSLKFGDDDIACPIVRYQLSDLYDLVLQVTLLHSPSPVMSGLRSRPIADML